MDEGARGRWAHSRSQGLLAWFWHAPTGQGDWLAARQATDSCVTTASNLRMGGTSSSRKVASERKHFILDSIYWPIRFGS